MKESRSTAHAALMALAEEQAGIVSRRQVLAAGLTDCWLQHRVAAGRWSRVHPGVYATFTGGLDWPARCWAALLWCGPGAALAGPTAVQWWVAGPSSRGRGAGDDDIVVAVDERCRVTSTDGVAVWLITDLERHVHPACRPRRMRLEGAALRTASRARIADDAIGVLADVCRSRRTTPARLYAALEQMPHNLRFRRVLREILNDVATGAYSYLEVHYLRDVERPHGLPTGARQRRVRPGRHPCYRDVDYLGFDVVAELDGRIGHEELVDRADDMDRDTDTERGQARTARIGYLQVMSRRCATAQRVADLLRLGGWSGRPRRCGPDCPVV
jgi:hypothetical protein